MHFKAKALLELSELLLPLNVPISCGWVQTDLSDRQTDSRCQVPVLGGYADRKSSEKGEQATLGFQSVQSIPHHH